MTHSYPIGEDLNKVVPAPQVRFDRIGGDSIGFTEQVYRLEFHRVGYAGYGRSSGTSPSRISDEVAAI